MRTYAHSKCTAKHRETNAQENQKMVDSSRNEVILSG